jgi:hypothetical protein
MLFRASLRLFLGSNLSELKKELPSSSIQLKIQFEKPLLPGPDLCIGPSALRVKTPRPFGLIKENTEAVNQPR